MNRFLYFLLFLFAGLPKIRAFSDYMLSNDKYQIMMYAKELIQDITLKVHQVDGLFEMYGEHFLFEVGFILGQIREKHKLQMEYFRQFRNKYYLKTNIFPPEVTPMKPLHYFVGMEHIHRLQMDIDHLVESLLRIPSYVLDSYQKEAEEELFTIPSNVTRKRRTTTRQALMSIDANTVAKPTSTTRYVFLRTAQMTPGRGFGRAPDATQVRAPRDFHTWQNSRSYSVRRMFELMRSYYASCEERIKYFNQKRFQLEHTREYEEGFMMGEIIERYRMMVENVHAVHKFKSFTYYDCLLRLEQIQKFYMEVFHLVNMMHEIPRKYGFLKTERDGKRPVLDKSLPDNIEDLELIMHNMKGREKSERKRIRERMVKLKEQREIMLLKQQWTTFATKSHTRWWWPLEYGWEIDYQWW